MNEPGLGELRLQLRQPCVWMMSSDEPRQHTPKPLDGKAGFRPVDAVLSSDRPTLVTEAEHPFRIVDVNAAWTRVCGFERHEARGLTPESLLQSDSTDKVAAKRFTAMLCASGSASATLSNRTKHGDEFIHKLDAKRVLDEHGLPLFVAQSTVLSSPQQRLRNRVSVLAVLLLAATIGARYALAQPSDQTVEAHSGHSALWLGQSEAVEPLTRHRMASARERAILCWLRRDCKSPIKASRRIPVARDARATRGLEGRADASRGHEMHLQHPGWRRKVGTALKKLLSVGTFVSLAALANADLLLLSAVPAVTSRY